MALKADKGGFDEADSGEEDGDGSVNNGEEWDVAGDEAVDSVAMEVMLPRWCIENGSGWLGCEVC